MVLTLLFREFKENCNIDDAIIDYTRKENEFSIHIYCLEKYMNTKKEKNRLLLCIINMDFPTTCAMDSQTGSFPKKK